MKGSQRMLVLIIAGIILLVVVAFGVVLLRPEPTYTADDDPQGVVHNYLLALQRGEYERARGYLAPDLQTGELIDFIAAVEGDAWRFELGSNVALSVSGSRLVGENAARVEVEKTVSYNELLGSSQNTRTFALFLSRVDEQWVIVGGEAYWDECWDEDANCRNGPRPRITGSSNP